MAIPEQNPLITVKTVGAEFVAYIRFVGGYADIPDHFARLREQVGEAICGDPLCLYDVTANEKPGEIHIEVCYPVDQTAKDHTLTRTLPGCTVVSMTWSGPALATSDPAGYAGWIE